MRTAALALLLCSSALAQQYQRFASGVCDEPGWESVDTPEECAKAAPHVGAKKCMGCDSKDAGANEWRDDRPGGCRAHKKDFCCAHFNNNLNPARPEDGLDESSTTGGWTAVCKRTKKYEL